MYNTIFVEKLNKPAVVLCNESFTIDGKSAASAMGVPGIRLVPLTVPSECGIMELIEAGTSAAIDDIVAALTKPMTPAEKSPEPEVIAKPSRITFKGNLEEVNRFYYGRGWTDGLPIIPPTEEAVKEMLTGTDLSADHVVEKIKSRMGKATVEKIAINAVMAGTLPIYMPVLIAGVQALMDPVAHFGHAQATTASYAPFWIINGPIRHDLNVNSGVGALNPGDMANAGIGRALGLIVKNLGGVRKGIEDMGHLGNPAKYTMVVAEDEEASPWEPLHVDAGLNKEDSALTLFFSMGFFPACGHHIADAKDLMNKIVSDLPAEAIFEKLCVLIGPRMAGLLGDAGWTKQEIKEFIVANARCPARLHSYKWWPWPPPKTQIPPSDLDTIPLFDSVERVGVVVCGGGHAWTGLVLGGPHFNIPRLGFVTKKVDLPANWSNLVEKYKRVIPSYASY